MDGPAVGLVGAGNCLDVDLRELLARAERVDLIDLDAEAIHAGCDAQQLTGHPRLRLHAPVDVTGGLVGSELDASVQGVPGEDALGGAPSEPITAGPTVRLPGGPFDVTVSLCVASQLIEWVTFQETLSPSEQSAAALRIRDQHLETLITNTASGGRVLLVTDFVSSDTCPEISLLGDDRLPAAAARWISQGNFFTGLNPFALAKRWRDDRRLSDTRVHRPWRWSIGERHFAVTGIDATRRS